MHGRAAFPLRQINARRANTCCRGFLPLRQPFRALPLASI